MESVRIHEARSREDARIADEITRTLGDCPWVIVVRFYAALHIMQAYLLTKHERFQADNHSAREKAIRAAPEISQGRGRPCYEAWKRLRALSEQVRYDPGFRPRDVDFVRAKEAESTVRSFVAAKVERAIKEAS